MYSAMSDIDTDGAIIELTQLTQPKCYYPQCSDSAIIELTQLTQPKCYYPQCSVLEKLNPPTKSDLACRLA